MTIEVTRPGSGAALADPQRPVRGGMFSACRAPGYTYVLVAGWFWTMGRWGCSFLGAYLANTMSGSARLVQLTGVALWAPLLVGGVLGGVISDRLDRRRTVITQFVVLIPLAVAMGLAGQTDRIELWMVYVFQVVVGVGWVIDMTSRRAIIYDLVGPTRLDNAMALESLSSASGLALGALVGGTIIQAVGTGAAYLCIAGLLMLSLLLFVQVPRVAPERGTGSGVGLGGPAGRVPPAAHRAGPGQRPRRHRGGELLLLQLHAARPGHRHRSRRGRLPHRRPGRHGRLRHDGRLVVRRQRPAPPPGVGLRGRLGPGHGRAGGLRPRPLVPAGGRLPPGRGHAAWASSARPRARW